MAHVYGEFPNQRLVVFAYTAATAAAAVIAGHECLEVRIVNDRPRFIFDHAAKADIRAFEKVVQRLKHRENFVRAEALLATRQS